MTESHASAASGQALHDLFREVFALQAALVAIMDRVHQQAGLNASQHKVMRVLTLIGPATVPDVASRLGVSRQFVQTVCNQLRAESMLEFRPNPRHKRSQLAALKEAGLSAFKQARQKENRIIARALPGFEPERATDARHLLESIRKALLFDT
jgi:DNA-binding MarR family transcriptional regulator